MISFSRKVEETMNSAQSVIQNAGVSANAAKIYTALLRKGKGNYSSLATATGLHPQSVKNAMRELTDQQFVVRLDHKLAQTLWRPVPPFEIAKRLRQQYEDFAKALPSLQGLFRQHPGTLVRVSAGWDEVIIHLKSHIENVRRGNTITLFGTSWDALVREKPQDWVDLESISGQRGVRWQRIPKGKSEGPISFAISDRRITMLIYDPTESIVLSIDQPRAAKQIGRLLR